LSISQFFHTVRYLRPEQITSRIAFRLRRPLPDLRPAPALRRATGAWIAPVRSTAAYVPPRRFRFLNVEREVCTAADWNNPEWDKLWLYNLHYFDVLNAEHAMCPRAAHELVLTWVRENPPCTGVGWDPYPLSLRIVNWIKRALGGGALPEEALQSLAVQARHLMQRVEWHLLGNHLLANAKALVFGGLFFTGAEADAWLEHGLAILERELPEQVLADGGHFELSPMYHSIVLEDVLDLLNLSSVYAAHSPRARLLTQPLEETAPRMLTWLRAMCHPDGEIAFFNDAAFAIAAPPDELERYARRLGVAGAPANPCEIQYLPHSGYVSARSGPVALIFDAAGVGPHYLPGHAHADTLSFELSWHGRRVICNSGTSCYGMGSVRAWERSTAAHNTVSVDGEDSSEVWNSFRVARRAAPFGFTASSSSASVVLSCAHGGYRRLRGQPVHRRDITIARGEVSWRDEVSGRGRHVVSAHIPLHPEVRVRAYGDSAVELACPGGTALALEAEAHVKLTVTRGTYAPEFGKVLERPVVRWTLEGELPLSAVMRLREL
jgi:uncharacterized heparinase superfamily protein